MSSGDMSISDQGRILFKNAVVGFRAHPERHQQATWICRTGCCLAGSVVLAAGAVPVFDRVRFRDQTILVKYEEVQQTIPGLAADLLGISPLDAEAVFAASNTIDDLEAMYSILDGGGHIREQCERCYGGRSTNAADEVLPHLQYNDCRCRAVDF